MKYKQYTIYYDPPPIPLRSCDWHFVHDDYDGGPEHSGDNPTDDRCGDGPTKEDCMRQIDELEES